MARVEVKGLTATLRRIDRLVEQEVEKLANETKETARAKTPVRTGNARRNWRERTDKRGFTVENRVPYIERLDQGSSKQAPRGIVGPTLTEIKRRSR